MSESYIEGNGIRLAYEEFGDPGPGAPAIRAFSRKKPPAARSGTYRRALARNRAKAGHAVDRPQTLDVRRWAGFFPL